jgi:hypothetical protein
MGELGYLALEEYDPGAAVRGVIGRAADESSPAWPTGRRCLRRVPGVGMRWMRGYGRWVRQILVWTKAPFCSGVSWWWQMLRRALLARPSRVR